MPGRRPSTSSVRSNARLRELADGRALFAAFLFARLKQEELRMRLDFDASPDAASRAALVAPMAKLRESILRVLLYPTPPKCPSNPFQRSVGSGASPMLIVDAELSAPPGPDPASEPDAA